MIISSLVEENGGDKRSGEGGGATAVGKEVGGAGMSDDDRHEYQTANQLFELMVQDHDFNSTEDDSLSQRDLVLIYKNLDLGTQLMSNANEFKRNRPNQYVETVVYKDEGDSDSSELSDTQYSSEDLYNMVLINKERIDLLNCSSAGNTLCNKLGDIRLTTSKLNSKYNSHNIYNNAYLKNLNLLSNSDDHSMLPDSLLDYICCKRLEDNYNFYMDSIIIYVKHTIDQLKRISDGDYLTDRVKERWREVDSKEKHNNKENGDTKILATCTSIPLHIERKMNGSYSKWDEIVHSEVDRRSLSKILEKKIIIEVPKVICDSYKLFTKCCADNLVISCKKQKKTEPPEKIEKDSRVDVVFQLKPSESGQVISNINSVMILHSAPTFKEEASSAEPLRITYKGEVDKVIPLQDNCKYDENYDEERVTEITENNVIATKKVLEQESTPQVPVASELVEALNITHVGSHGDTNVCPYEKVNAPQLEPTIRLGNVKKNIKIPTADLLSMTIQRLNQNALTCMPEESEDEIIYNVPYKKKLLPKRVKSPYENKTYLIEEKKRKHLLEIRQKREKKKKAMGENNTLNIHKYVVDSMAPRASNSITQISISNKSFYNSIFGKTSRDTFKQAKSKSKRKYQKTDLGINKNYIEVDSLEGDSLSWNGTESSGKKKCINYDLDDIETEMMQTTNVRNESTSSPDCSAKFNYSESIEVSVTFSDQGSSNQQFSNSQSVIVGPSVKNEKKDSNENEGFEKFTSASECRKNISKIYDLVQKLGKTDVETKPTKSKFTAFNDKKCNNVPDQDYKTVQLSDSAGSIKNHLPSSDSSLPNLEINSNKETNQMQTKKKERINSPRSQIPRYHGPKGKEVKSFKPQTQYDNPLKAISDLIHNLDNLKKPNTEKIAKFRTVPEVKPGRKPEINNKDEKHRKNNFHVDSPDTQTVKKQRPLRLDNHVGIGKVLKPKLTDIIDEQKEARGEAVKGPSTTSRIDALAQPRKSYVQAHREEIMARSGRRQKPALGTQMAGKISAKTSVGVSSRQQRNYPEPMSRRRLVSPLPAQLERQRSLSPQYPARAPASVPPPRATIGYARGSAPLSPPRSSPMTSWVAATDHRQQNNRRHAKVVPDPIIIKKETRTVKHVSYEDPVITQVRTRSPSPPKYLEREFRALKPIEINPNLGETVQAIINNMPSTATGTVTDLTCSSDSYSHFSKDNCISEPVSFNCTYSVTSNHEVDIFEDKSIVTEVQGIQDIEDSETSKPEKENLDKTSTEMRKLEFVLNRQKLQGNFQKRLRIKNLTLRPDRSTRKMFVLQSGDAGSMLLDSTSDNYLINDASKHQFEWSLSNIPMQVNTIGYSFTKFKSVQCGQSEFKFNALCKCNERKAELFVVGPTKTCQCSSTSDLKCNLAYTETGDNAEQIEEKAVTAYDSQQIKTKIFTELTNVEQQRSLVRTIDKHLKSDTEVKSNQSADESNSLDVLVGLLNEIQKITACQTNITNTFPRSADYETTANNNNLEAIIKEAAIAKLVGCGLDAKNAGDNPLEMLSITSLEKLRQLESDPSLYSLYISNIDDFIERNNSAPVSMRSEDMQILPPYKDVEVSVNIPKKEYISRVTDVPSTLLTLSLNKSTDVSDSLCRLLKESSTSRPANSCSTQHQPIYVNSDYQSCRCTIDLAKTSTEQTLKQHVARSSKIKELAEDPKVTEPLKSDKNICITKNNKDSPSSELSRKISDYCTEASELDHVMKIKRDILVTVYSILVFTVFAALSFPAELI